MGNKRAAGNRAGAPAGGRGAAGGAGTPQHQRQQQHGGASGQRHAAADDGELDISRDVQRKLSISSRPAARKAADDMAGTSGTAVATPAAAETPSAAAIMRAPPGVVYVPLSDDSDRDKSMAREAKRLRAAEQAAVAAAAATAAAVASSSARGKKKKKEKKKSGAKKRSWAAAAARPAGAPMAARPAGAGAAAAAASGATAPGPAAAAARAALQLNEAAAAAVTLWRSRCRRIILNCLEDEAYGLVCRSMASWPIDDVYALVSEWEPNVVSAVFTPDSCTPERISNLMARFSADFVATCCESWTPHDICQVLPRLKLKMARKVLGHLYFESDDPYLSTAECKQLLMSFSERKRTKLCKKLNAELVRRVMANESNSSDELEDDYGRSEDDDSYESSFVNDDEEEEDEGEEEDVEMAATGARR